MQNKVVKFLVGLFVLCVVIYAITLVLPLLGLPYPFGHLIMLIILVVVFFWLLKWAGIFAE